MKAERGQGFVLSENGMISTARWKLDEADVFTWEMASRDAEEVKGRNEEIRGGVLAWIIFSFSSCRFRHLLVRLD